MYGTFWDAPASAPLLANSVASALEGTALTDEANKLVFLRYILKTLNQGLPQYIKSQLQASFTAILRLGSDANIFKLLQYPSYYEQILIACLRLGHIAYSRSALCRGKRSLSKEFIQKVAATNVIVLPDNVVTLLGHWGYGSGCSYFYSWRRGGSGVSKLPTPEQALNLLKDLEVRIKAEKHVIERRQQIQQRLAAHMAAKSVSVFVAREQLNGAFTKNISTSAMLLDDGEIVLLTDLDKTSTAASNFHRAAHDRIGDYWPCKVQLITQTEGKREFKVCSQHLPVGMDDLAEGDPNVLALLQLLSVFDVLIKGRLRCAGDWKDPNHLVNLQITGGELTLKLVRIDTDTACPLDDIDETGCEVDSHPSELGCMSTLNFARDNRSNSSAFRANKDIRSCIVNFVHELMYRSGEASAKKFKQLAGTSLENLFSDDVEYSAARSAYMKGLAFGYSQARNIIEKSLQHLIDRGILNTDVGGMLLEVYKGTRTEASDALSPSKVYEKVQVMAQKLEDDRGMSINRILIVDATRGQGSGVFAQLKQRATDYFKKKITGLLGLIRAGIITQENEQLVYAKLVSEMRVYMQDGFFDYCDIQQLISAALTEANPAAGGSAAATSGVFAMPARQSTPDTIKAKLLTEFHKQYRGQAPVAATATIPIISSRKAKRQGARSDPSELPSKKQQHI